MSNIDLKDLVELMKEQLEQGKTVSFVPRGKSMEPMLKGGEDVVFLKKPEGRLKLFDVALYYRKETDRYVIHRVVGFCRDGSYVMLGDNNLQREFGIFDEDVVAVVTGYTHKGQTCSVDSLGYKLYCKVWFCFKPFRHIIAHFKGFFRKFKK